MKNSLLTLLIFFFITACSENDYSHEKYESIGMEEEIHQSEQPSETVDIDEPGIDSQKKIIKEGEMRIEVTKLLATKRTLDSLIRDCKGYYAKEDFQDSHYQSTYTLIVRIPNQSYEHFISMLEAGKGKILYKNIEARDVTEQYVDIHTRLENKRTYLKHYREILKKANTINEILEVEQHIRKLEEEIESAEGRLRYLSDRVSYSTLNLTVFQPKEYIPEPSKEDNFFYRLKNSFADGWEIFVSFLLLIITFWPFVILIPSGWYLWRKWRRRKTL